MFDARSGTQISSEVLTLDRGTNFISNNTSCPLCGAAEHEVVFDLRSVRNALSVPGLVARCHRCPMWFKVITQPEDLAQVYTDEYAANEVTEPYMLGEPARAFFRTVLDGVDTVRTATKPRLLDIGTGLGALLEEAQKLGYDAEGVDLCEPLVRKARARGLRVQCKAAEELDSEAAFDVVTMMDVIEHVPQPLRLLAAGHRVLKPGGKLVVYTPNHRGAIVVLAKLLHTLGISFAVREIFGGNHVCFFDDRSLPAALRSQGFTVRSVSLFPYDPSRPGGLVSAISLVAITAVEWIGKPFNRMFRMLVYASK